MAKSQIQAFAQMHLFDVERVCSIKYNIRVQQQLHLIQSHECFSPTISSICLAPWSNAWFFPCVLYYSHALIISTHRLWFYYTSIVKTCCNASLCQFNRYLTRFCLQFLCNANDDETKFIEKMNSIKLSFNLYSLSVKLWCIRIISSNMHSTLSTFFPSSQNRILWPKRKNFHPITKNKRKNLNKISP